ncbi:subunit of the oligosaccharyltransferase complex [Pseudozyma hubeiensis SY62]|uniref:Subunit of the oligosaccharyltransferase complex n=1 Tax=Pseudozyma hubeiensis (strain SY62) TaxID=1305764 RepID=R9NWU2_PSEHS|nr:subunit of the oligosaccharyltransferase complex [Pseudozyma hubeiensis SY62]GAC93019.1 subunit of the oligosaccharyltransferase complex [Pseudozyma hubeiensis SY62]
MLDVRLGVSMHPTPSDTPSAAVMPLALSLSSHVSQASCPSPRIVDPSPIRHRKRIKNCYIVEELVRCASAGSNIFVPVVGRKEEVVAELRAT